MIDFLKYRYVCMFISVAALFIGVAGYFAKGGFKYAIDFKGGTELRVAFAQPLDIAQLRHVVEEKIFKGSELQSLGIHNKEFLVRVGLDVQAGDNIEEVFKKEVSAAIPGNELKIEAIDHVGAAAGEEVQTNAIIAIVLALLLMMAYMAVRFKFAYGVGTMVAVAHDVLAILMYLLFTGEPLSLNVLAAILAMLGYSINDSIIIFSRIRENMVLLKGTSAVDIVNISVNQTLRRTLLASGATLLSVLALFFLGGEALHSISVAMIIGIVVGTYSSIYIASPVMLALDSTASK